MVWQLKDFKAGRRAHDSGLMQPIAQTLTDADIEDLGNYFSAMRIDSGQ